MSTCYLVGNKAKGQISKRVFQEKKARQIFWKMNISYPLIHKRICAYEGVRNVSFSENLACFVFLKHPFWDSPFCLITYDLSLICNLCKNFSLLHTNHLRMGLDESQYTAICFEFLRYQMIFLHGRHRVLVEGSPVKHCLYVLICSKLVTKKLKQTFIFHGKAPLRIFFK